MRFKKFGSATIYQGDCLDILRCLEGGFSAVLTDPPYSSGGLHVGSRKISTKSKYIGTESPHLDFSGDNKDQRSFTLWSCLWMGMARELCLPGALGVFFTDWRQIPATTDAVQGGGWIWRGIGAWDKTEGSRPNSGLFRHQCEFFAYGTNGSRPRGGVALPGYFRASAMSEPKYHLAGKPVALMEHVLPILGDHILDPFAGSGTVGVACLRQGKSYTGIELDSHSFDVACRRLEEAHRAQEGAGA